MNFIVNTETNKVIGTGMLAEGQNELLVQSLDEDVLNAYREFQIELNKIDRTIEVGIEFYLKYDGSNIIVTTIEDKAVILADNMVKRLDKLNSEYILERYSLKRQTSFMTLKMDAMEINRQDIIDECNKIKNWIFNYPMTYYYQKEYEVFQMRDSIIAGNDTLEDMLSLKDTWDFEQFTQYDPVMTIAEIRAMFEE